MKPEMKNASHQRGVNPVRGTDESNRTKKKILLCDDKHFARLRQELFEAGLSLKVVRQNRYLSLLSILQYLGARGFNTMEGAACGFVRIAPRIQELRRAGWEIVVRREAVVNEDGVQYFGIARYVLVGRSEFVTRQISFNFGGVMQ